MNGQAFKHVMTIVASRLSGWAPEWMGAMFFGQPIAVPIRFGNSDDPEPSGRLSSDLLTREVSTEGVEKKVEISDAYVPAEFFFERRLSLPRGARGKLEVMAALDLRSKTPFDLTSIQWVLGAPNIQSNTLYVSQWIVRTDDLEKWRANLRKAGYQIRKFYVNDETVHQPIADYSDKLLPGRRFFRRTNAGLGAIVALMIIVVWLFPGWSARNETRELQLELEALRSEALLERRRVDAVRKSEAQKAAFVDAVMLRPMLLDTVRELTVSLEDDVWVSTLTFNESRIVITGEASNSAAETVLSLGSRSGFVNPRLSGPVSRTANGSEQFEITLDLGEPG